MKKTPAVAVASIQMRHILTLKHLCKVEADLQVQRLGPELRQRLPKNAREQSPSHEFGWNKWENTKNTADSLAQVHIGPYLC